MTSLIFVYQSRGYYYHSRILSVYQAWCHESPSALLMNFLLKTVSFLRRSFNWLGLRSWPKEVHPGQWTSAKQRLLFGLMNPLWRLVTWTLSRVDPCEEPSLWSLVAWSAFQASFLCSFCSTSLWRLPNRCSVPYQLRQALTLWGCMPRSKGWPWQGRCIWYVVT